MHIYFYVIDSKTYMQSYNKQCTLSTVKALIDLFVTPLFTCMTFKVRTADWPICAIVSVV